MKRSRYFGAGSVEEVGRLEAQAIALSGELTAEAKFLSLRPGLEVLDAGCGPGAITRWIAKQVAPARVVGVDADSAFILAARKEAERQGVSNAVFLEQSIDKMEFRDANFDLSYCRLVLPFLRNPFRALLELKRVTRPGGRVAIVEFVGVFAFHEPSLGLKASEKIAKYLNRGGKSWATSYDPMKLMKKAGLRDIKTYPIPDFASQENPKRLRELLAPMIMQQEIYGEKAVKAKFLSKKDLLLGKRELDRFLANPESFWMALTMLRVGVV